MKYQTISLKQFFWYESRDLSCSHSNGDIFTCEDNMLFSLVKISSFRAKAHLVFHWCLYNKEIYPVDGAILLLNHWGPVDKAVGCRDLRNSLLQIKADLIVTLQVTRIISKVMISLLLGRISTFAILQQLKDTQQLLGLSMILKNYADRGVKPRWISLCKNPIMVLFFIPNNLVERALSKARLLKSSRFFFRTQFVGPAFLAKTVETGDKNHDDFHCMEMIS